MDIEQQLKEEYLFLQQTYEDFDNRALMIKGWCITISLGAATFGFSEGDFSKALCLFIAGSAALFWLIEAKWKTFQYANAYRIRILEAHFRGDEKYKDLKPFQIYNSWYRAYMEDPPVHEYEKNHRGRTPAAQTIANAKLTVVYVPYLFIFIAGLIGAICV